MQTVTAAPLTASAYAPFGAVVEAKATPPRSANHGRAEAWDDLVPLVNARPGARPTASLFRCAPLQGARLEIRWLERHAHSTQLFVPMSARRYLVVVAGGHDAPDLDTLAAFVASGAQAITYAPGVWHHPMVALDASIDFVNFIHVDGSAADCDEVGFDPPVATVVVPSTV